MRKHIGLNLDHDYADLTDPSVDLHWSTGFDWESLYAAFGEGEATSDKDAEIERCSEALLAALTWAVDVEFSAKKPSKRTRDQVHAAGVRLTRLLHQLRPDLFNTPSLKRMAAAVRQSKVK